MPSFPEDVFRRKLAALHDTQDAIEILSHWVQFHRSSHQAVVAVWCDYFFSLDVSASAADAARRRVLLAKMLTLLFMVNDVVQNCKRKNVSEYTDSFGPVLPSTIQHFYATAEKSASVESVDDLLKRMSRMLSIWEERRIFSDSDTRDILAAIPKHHRMRPAVRGNYATQTEGVEQKLLADVRGLAESLCDSAESPLREYGRWRAARVTANQEGPLDEQARLHLAEMRGRVVEHLKRRRTLLRVLQDLEKLEEAKLNEQSNVLRDLEGWLS